MLLEKLNLIIDKLYKNINNKNFSSSIYSSILTPKKS